MMSNFKTYSLSCCGRIIALPLELIILTTFATLLLSPFLFTLVTIKCLHFCVEFEALDILRGLGGAIRASFARSFTSALVRASFLVVCDICRVGPGFDRSRAVTGTHQTWAPQILSAYITLVLM